MKSSIITLAAAAAALTLGAALPALAQAPIVHHHQPGEAAARFGYQANRINQGVGSGQLTTREQYRLQGREARLQGRVDRDRANDHGYLSAGERARINRSQNRISRSIYRDKHNAAMR